MCVKKLRLFVTSEQMYTFYNSIRPFSYVAGSPWTHRWHGPTKTHLCRGANGPAIFQFVFNGNWLSQEPEHQFTFSSALCLIC